MTDAYGNIIPAWRQQAYDSLVQKYFKETPSSSNMSDADIAARNAKIDAAQRFFGVPDTSRSAGGYQGGGVMPPDMGIVPEEGNPQIQGMGTDTVPAMLSPKEMVLTQRQQTAVRPIPGKEHMLKPEQRQALKSAAKRGGSFNRILKKR
jgi:hypothetical protein